LQAIWRNASLPRGRPRWEGTHVRPRAIYIPRLDISELCGPSSSHSFTLLAACLPVPLPLLPAISLLARALRRRRSSPQQKQQPGVDSPVAPGYVDVNPFAAAAAPPRMPKNIGDGVVFESGCRPRTSQSVWIASMVEDHGRLPERGSTEHCHTGDSKVATWRSPRHSWETFALLRS